MKKQTIIYILVFFILIWLVVLFVIYENWKSIFDLQKKWENVDWSDHILDMRSQENRFWGALREIEEYKINRNISWSAEQNNRIPECSFFFSDSNAYILTYPYRLEYLPNIDTGSFMFLYREHINDGMYWTPCYFKDKNYVYRDNWAIFSGFDYNTLHALTGMVQDPKTGKNVETSCLWWCFEDKDAIYYQMEYPFWIRDTTKIFPVDEWSFDIIRDKVGKNIRKYKK